MQFQSNNVQQLHRTMNLLNVASLKLGARILQVSSTQDQIAYSPTNILDQNKQRIWTSEDGLPQYIIIGLDQILEPFKNISSIGIYSSHDYATNPKVIELWVANAYQPQDDAEEQFIHWEDISLLKKQGMQVFNIDQIPQSYRFIKLIITETYGEYQTYLNQILLLAEPTSIHSSSSLLNHQQWNQMGKGFMKNAQKPASSPPYLQKMMKQTQRQKDISDYLDIQHQSPIYRMQDKIKFSRKEYDLANQQYEEEIDEEQSEQQYYIKKSHKKIFPKNHQYSQKHKQSRFQSNNQSMLSHRENSEHGKDVALYGLSKNMSEMEENIEQLNRKIQILEIKVDTAYSSFQKKLIAKVQDIVERQLTKQLSQKNLLERRLTTKQQSQDKRLKSSSNRKLGTSRETKRINNEHQNIRETRQPESDYQFKKYRKNESKMSQRTLELHKQLQKKLKQREKKVKKLMEKELQESRYRKNHYKQATNQYYRY